MIYSYHNNFSHTENDKEAAEDIRKAVNAFGTAVNYFTKSLDEMVPWKVLVGKIKDLYKHRADYEQETIDLIKMIGSHVMEGISLYINSTKSVYEWSGTAVPILTTYQQLFNTDAIDVEMAQRTLLLSVLDDGKQVLKQSLPILTNCSAQLNDAAEQLQPLSARLGIEYDFGGKYYKNKIIRKYRKELATASPLALPHMTSTLISMSTNKLDAELYAELNFEKNSFETLKVQLIKAINDFDQTNALLKIGSRIIRNLKLQDIKVLGHLDQNLKELIKESVQNLINNCNEFRKRYIY